VEEVTLAAQCPTLQFTFQAIESFGTLIGSFNLDQTRSLHFDMLQYAP
jgi:hypothetical protein